MEEQEEEEFKFDWSAIRAPQWVHDSSLESNRVFRDFLLQTFKGLIYANGVGALAIAATAFFLSGLGERHDYFVASAFICFGWGVAAGICSVGFAANAQRHFSKSVQFIIAEEWDSSDATEKRGDWWSSVAEIAMWTSIVLFIVGAGLFALILLRL